MSVTITTLPSNESAHVKEIYVGDKKSKLHLKVSLSQLLFDKEVDVSKRGGCL